MDARHTIVFDLDDTLCSTKNRDYSKSQPIEPVVDGLRRLKEEGWTIVIMTARGMGRSGGNIESVREDVVNEVETFLNKFDIPYDQIQVGKPWAHLYVDDKAIRPDEFARGVEEIIQEHNVLPELWG